MTVVSTIRDQIKRLGPGAVFTPAHFLEAGSRDSVDQALSRLHRAGAIRRLSRGVYDVPRSHPRIGPLQPSPDQVAHAVANDRHAQLQPTGPRAAYALGLTTQVPAVTEYFTDGRARAVRLGKLTVRLRRGTPTDMLLAGTRAGMAVVALRYLGRRSVDQAVLDKLSVALSDDDKRHLRTVRRKVPVWLSRAIDCVAGEGA